VLDHARILRSECGQDFVPDADPFEGALVVRGIVDEWELAPDGVSAHIGTTAIEQWADDAVRPSSLDPPKTAEPGAAKHPREHRFRLVVLRVPYGDAGDAASARHLLERSVSKLARARLKRGTLLHELDTRRVEGHAECARKRAYLCDFR
jgi:hypothetical protein